MAMLGTPEVMACKALEYILIYTSGGIYMYICIYVYICINIIKNTND